MATSSSAAFERWAFGIGRSHHNRHGRMDVRRGSSVRSDGIALTMSLCSASGTFATCSMLTNNITMRLVRTYRCTRTHRFRAPSKLSVARWRCQFWADCTTNISERKFPTGTALGPAWGFALGVLDFARGDLRHHDGRADHIGGTLLTSGAFWHIESIEEKR